MCFRIKIFNSEDYKLLASKRSLPFIPQIQGPNISDEDINQIVGELADNENTIYSLMEKSKEYMHVKELFVEAAAKWRRLSEMVQNEAYFVQQWALCTYKSKQPSKLKALTDANYY